MKIYSTIEESITPQQQEAIRQAFAWAEIESDARVDEIRAGKLVVCNNDNDEVVFLLDQHTLEITQP